MSERRNTWLVAVILSVTSLLGAGAASAGVIFVAIDQAGQPNADCAQDVRFVFRLRSMFNAVFDRFPGDVTVEALRADMNQLIPPMECIHGVALPVEGFQDDAAPSTTVRP